MSTTVALRARIAEEIGRAETELIGSPSLSVGYVINRLINQSIDHYESARFRWNEVREDALATTVSGTRNYTLPPSFVRMDTLKLVYSGSFVPLRPWTWNQIEEEDRTVSTAPGLPARFSIYGNILRLYPAPNGAYSLVGSYIRRFPPTSLTGSNCNGIIMPGGGTLTITATASHNSRRDGWTIQGADLIAARAKALYLIDYERDLGAAAESQALIATNQPYLSHREKQAFERLMDETNDAIATGLVRPYAL